MKRLLGKLLCRLGRHDWRPIHTYWAQELQPAFFLCDRCGRTEWRN